MEKNEEKQGKNGEKKMEKWNVGATTATTAGRKAVR